MADVHSVAIVDKFLDKSIVKGCYNNALVRIAANNIHINRIDSIDKFEDWVQDKSAKESAIAEFKMEEIYQSIDAKLDITTMEYSVDDLIWSDICRYVLLVLRNIRDLPE
jgi:hypothetical protein